MGKKAKAQKRGLSAGCFALFALPFAGVGVFMAWLTFATWSKGNAAKRWVEVPAKILSAKLEENRDSEGSTTYRAVAQFEYQFEGRTYRGDRVSFHGGADNIGSFQEDAAEELREYAGRDEMFRCYVDPKAPGESVLFRDLRWGMLAFYAMFAVVFGGVGFGMLAGALISRKKAQVEEELEQESPDEPWLWREDWAQGQIEYASGRFAAPLVVATLFVNLVAWPTLLLAILPELRDGGNKAALFGLLFPVAALGMAAASVRSLAKRRKFGETRFEMASVPGVLGGKLAGVIHIPNQIKTESGFRQTLRCVRREVVRSGKNNTVREQVLWEGERHLNNELLPGDNTRTAIPVLFAIPLDLPESSTNTNTQSGVVWRLEVEAEIPGVDFKATYEVPVFKTAESSPEFELDTTPIANLIEQKDPNLIFVGEGIRVNQDPRGGTSYVFPPGRHLGLALFLTLFTGIWWAIVIALFQGGAPWLFRIVFGGAGLLMLLALAGAWLHTRKLYIGPNGVAASSGLLIRWRERRFNYSEIEEVEVDTDMQVGNEVYHHVALSVAGGKKRKVSGSMRSRRAADLLAETIMEYATGR